MGDLEGELQFVKLPQYDLLRHSPCLQLSRSGNSEDFFRYRDSGNCEPQLDHLSYLYSE